VAVAVAVAVKNPSPITRERDAVGVNETAAVVVPIVICPHPTEAANAKKNSLRIISLVYPYNAEYS
jgi:hypothetical protein